MSKQERLATVICSHKKLIFVLGMAVVFMLFCIAYYLGTLASKLGHESLESGQVLTDDDAVPIDEEYLKSWNGNPQDGITNQTRGFIHHCFSNLYFVSGQIRQEMPVWNDPQNIEGMVVDVYVTGVEQPIFTSGLIKPGMMLKAISLNYTLAQGDYTATVVSTPIDTGGGEGCSLSSVVDVHVE